MVVLWEVARAEMRHAAPLCGHTDSLCSLAWSPDDAHLLTCAHDQLLMLWASASGECLRTYRKHTDSVMACVKGDSYNCATWNSSLTQCASTCNGTDVKTIKRAEAAYGSSWNEHAPMVGHSWEVVCAWEAIANLPEVRHQYSSTRERWTPAPSSSKLDPRPSLLQTAARS